VPAFSPSQLLISHCKKYWRLDPWRLHFLGKADEDWWPYGCFAARTRRQVCSCRLQCHRQPLCGHHTAQKMKHVAFGKKLQWNNRPCARFHLKQNVSFQGWKNPLRFQPLVRARPYRDNVTATGKSEGMSAQLYASILRVQNLAQGFFFYISFYCTTSLITDYKYTYVTING